MGAIPGLIISPSGIIEQLLNTDVIPDELACI